MIYALIPAVGGLSIAIAAVLGGVAKAFSTTKKS